MRPGQEDRLAIPAEPEAPPRRAVVVPAYNRPERLAGCLEALVALDAPAGEAPPVLVVVDDGSAEPLAPVCARFGDRVCAVRQDNAGPAAARNRGVAESGADFVAFTDDDCRPEPGWLAALAAAHGGEAGRLVGGRTVNALSDDVCAEASQSMVDYLYAHADVTGGGADFFTSNNIACDRATFEAMGGFDESFPLAAGEDRDFGLRWRAAGGTLDYAPDAVVRHYHAMSLKGFWRQHANYGRGARHLHARLAARADRGSRFQALGFYLGLVLHPLSDGRPRPLARTGLMALSQAATLAGYLRTR